MANSNADKQLEDAIGAFFRFAGRMIAGFFRALFKGIKKLSRLKYWIGLGITLIITLAARFFLKDIIWALEVPIYIKWLVYVLALSAPIIYLLIIGNVNSKSQEEYEKIFSDIGFVGKDKKAPFFCGENADGKKKILTFKSNIPLPDWKAARSRLETALDCNILKMEYGNSKKLVHLTVLPAEYKIPDKINWDDSYCSDKDGIITVGQSALDNISFNLNRVPHVLVAGETGSGKSVILRCILWQMILQGCKVFMIDFKGGVEFGKQYEHYGEVITERERALAVLDMLVGL